MSSEADQQEPAVESQELVSRDPVSPEPEPEGTVSAAASPAPAAVRTARPRAGVPAWRTGKPDAFLAAAVETARSAIEGITAPADIGRHLGAKSEGDRLVTHLFESRLPGYGGWQWFAVLTRNSRSKVVTVNELGLLPSEDSILAPEWVPWAERVRPEDEQEPEREQEPETETETAEAGPAESDAAEDAVAGPEGQESEAGAPEAGASAAAEPDQSAEGDAGTS
ncbi:DUF3027 domain-containing protein [Arthrobacter sp. W4I7]|uniref:DUF3027 domain-containing protein n=1 Tax=Arthrobacter sp. W4I7 TaxID=3042296 RepID=UPI00278580EA|nr:DUF3027 domain-containing protein [Arthrobacter sp. W4I7]MDQ0692358.1 hypothetical protein [Arthrobacter sp. W4I7]